MATRDYKTRERSRPNRGRRGSSGFFWFVTGAVFGAFGVGLAWTLQDRALPPTSAGPQTRAAPPTKPNFVFHQLLPEMEVLVPDEELSASAPPPPRPKPATGARPVESRQTEPQQVTKPTEPAADGTSYLVQVASLRNSSDAEQLKAKLALLGVRTRIQQVTVNGESYFRVRAGPYKGKQEVNKTRALLSSNGLESIAIKLR